MVDHGNASNERRKHPRAQGNLPVKICAEEFDAVTETKNLSRSGVFCRVNQAIEPMTKLKIQLLLSYKQNGKMSTKKVSCGGVVVRCQQESQEKHFNMAIYFNEIRDKDASAIAEYVHCMLSKEEESA